VKLQSPFSELSFVFILYKSASIKKKKIPIFRGLLKGIELGILLFRIKRQNLKTKRAL
jgi:hypothetical protein